MSVPAPVSQGELRSITAAELFLAAGSEACCGFPLPNGLLPIGARGQGGEVWLMSQPAWDEYRSLCAAERAALEA